MRTKNYNLLIVFIFMVYIYSFQGVSAQNTIKTKEVKVNYNDGFLVFNICTSGCATEYKEGKKYFWYTEYSKVKSTKGGSGGSLLHGNCKFYDKSGNLLEDKNYHLGLLDGEQKTWDKRGNITSIVKNDKGDIVYWKFQDDEEYWIEHIGRLFTEGWTKKTYTKYNVLLEEQTRLKDFRMRIKTYYSSNKLKEEYVSDLLGKCMMGKYDAYHENGNIKISGQFYDGTTPVTLIPIRVGVWKWYNLDGTLYGAQQYKADFEFWDSGEKKSEGGLFLSPRSNKWLRTGTWNFYNEDGSLQLTKNMNEL